MINRVLKFKALYKGKLHIVESINLFENTVNISSPRSLYLMKINPDKLVQYIGINDVNNVEIYEGDYDKDGVCALWCNSCHSWQFGQIDIPTGEIVISCHHCDGNFFLDDHINEFTIIGNTYLL